MRDAWLSKKRDDSVPIRRTETPADLQRGDVIVFWEGGDAIVTATLDCIESGDGRERRWRWLFSSSGSMIETLGDCTSIYQSGDVIEPGTAAFQRLTCPVQEGGILQTFEARMRDGSIVTDPVAFRIDGAAYRPTETGTFLATRVGPLDSAVWRDLSDEERQNVYVRMQSSDGDGVLGVWTTGIRLMRGRPLLGAEIKGLYGA